MSCYMRHMKNELARAGLESLSKAERKVADRAVRDIVGAGDIPCNQVWKMVKEWIGRPGGADELAARLREKVNSGK